MTIDDKSVRDRIRMELFKEAYLQWCPKIKEYTGNVAESMAIKAAKAFDEYFDAMDGKK